MTDGKTAARPWGGRFDATRLDVVERLNASLPFDWRLAPYDLWQNRVYGQELLRIGVLDAQDGAGLTAAFATVEAELRAGTFPFELGHEDVHMSIEARLVALCGDAGKRLHTGRSRNDQVATVFRLWLRDAVDALGAALQATIAATLEQSERHADLPVPGYTHLQRAQVVSFGHHLHAYAEMLLRDLERLSDLRRRLNRCPLGSAALAGSPYPLDRERLARELGFTAATRNSMDAVADRDFALEFLSFAAVTGVHLSRWAEDVILWMSQEFGWIKLPDAFCTGSSIMPQKKNPDIAELARGKSGRWIGHLTGLLATVKGLPLTYNKDLQEDKEPVFDAALELLRLLQAWAPLVAAIAPEPQRMAAALRGGHLLATDLADWLVRVRGVPFRDAHHIVGRAVRAAEDAGKDVADLTAGELQAVDARLTAEACAVLDVAASLRARDVVGGPARVRDNVAATRQALAAAALPAPTLAWALELAPPLPWTR